MAKANAAPNARGAVLRQLQGAPLGIPTPNLGGIAHGLGDALDFVLHGGGQRQANQMDWLTMMLRNAGLHPSEATSIAEGLVYHPYNRPT